MKFAEGKPAINHVGEEAPAALQRAEFLQPAAQLLGEPLLAQVAVESWTQAFLLVEERWQGPGKRLLALDEFQWTAAAAPSTPCATSCGQAGRPSAARPSSDFAARRCRSCTSGEEVAAATTIGEFWANDVQIDTVTIRDDGVIELGECKWGLVRSPGALRESWHHLGALYGRRQ